MLRAIQRGPYLILAGVFPLEALDASFPAEPMVEMTQILLFTFGGLVQRMEFLVGTGGEQLQHVNTAQTVDGI